MNRYLIETPHSEADCRLLIEQLYAMGYLHNFEWGCADDVHCGWAILEAENETQARLSVPSVVRDQVRVVRLVKFDVDDAKQLHPY